MKIQKVFLVICLDGIEKAEAEVIPVYRWVTLQMGACGGQMTFTRQKLAWTGKRGEEGACVDAEVTSVALRLEEQGNATFSSLKRIEARACVSARFWIWKNAHCWGGMT